MAEYIDREAALEICETEYQERLRMLDYCGDTVAWNIGHAIKAIPTADVVPVVRGWWEHVDSSYWRWTPSGGVPVSHVTYRCGRCGRGTVVKTSYCPNCGAKMDEKEDKDG